MSLPAALTALQNQDYATAERLLRRLVQKTPDNADVLHCLGIALHGQGQNQQALSFLDRALRHNPRDSRAHNNRANTLAALHRPEDALASFRAALALNPNDPQLHYNTGNTLLTLNRVEEALAAFDRALSLAPDLAQAQQNRGIALTRLGRAAEALAAFDALLARRAPGLDVPELRANRAASLDQLNRREDALAECDAVLAADPNQALAHWNAAIVSLSLGDLRRGWREWEWRWKTPDFARERKRWHQPLWLNDAPLAGKRILLHSEQGLGDLIQFCRYVPMVKALGAEVVLEVAPPLLRLMQTLQGVDRLIAVGEDPGPVDYQTPVMSLPLAFDTVLQTIPAATPYLAADPVLVAKWRDVLGPRTAPRVGLAWSGNPQLKSDAQRSAPLASLAPLILPGIAYVAVQKDVRPADQAALAALGVRFMGDQLADFADTAALMESLDLVISVDTGPAHLAGALGRPVWLLLHAIAEWRWLMHRSDSPWYPSARLFRQQNAGDWHAVAQQVEAAERHMFSRVAG